MQVNDKSTRTSQQAQAVIYLRIATAQDADAEQVIDAQRQACERRAREMDVTVTDIFVDHGSRRTLAGRPGLRTLLEKIAAGQNVEYLITYDEARLARSMRAYGQIAQTLKAAGVKIIIASMSPAVQQFAVTLSEYMGVLASEHRQAIRRNKGVRP